MSSSHDELHSRTQLTATAAAAAAAAGVVVILQSNDCLLSCLLKTLQVIVTCSNGILDTSIKSKHDG
jgi:hypothetical protein